MEGSGRIRKGRASGSGRRAGEGRRGPRRPPRAATVRPPLLPARGGDAGGGAASRPPLSLVFPTRGVEGALPGRPCAGGRGPRRGGGGGSEARQEQSDSGCCGD